MRIKAIHFWDTRPELRDFWPKALPIWEHNFEVMGRGSYWEVEHVVFLNWVADRPCVLDWLREHDIRYVRWDKKLSNRGHDHLVVFNKVAAQAYHRIDLGDTDAVFVCTQDFVMVNHYDDNFFVVLWELMLRDWHQRNATLGWYNHPGICEGAYNYASHTVTPGAPSSKFRHNASASVGMWRISEKPFMLESVNQVERAAEVHLGRVLNRHCVYLRAVPEFYFGSWKVDPEHRQGEWGEMIASYAQDPCLTGMIRGWQL